MIQFNLLPDVKLEYVKTQRTKHLLTLVSVITSVVCLAVLVLAIVSVDVVQKKSLNDLSDDVTRYSTQLKNVKDLDKILTVQNQLSTLTTLHNQKPVTSRFFTYISQVTPADVSFSQFSVDFTNKTIIITGTTHAQATVSTYTDTLKAAKYTTDASSVATHAFSSVVLSSSGHSGSGASFSITCAFDPVIFDTTRKVTLTVPQGVDVDADQSSSFEGEK